MINKMIAKLTKKLEYKIYQSECNRRGALHNELGVTLNNEPLNKKLTGFLSQSTLPGILREYKLNELNSILNEYKPLNIIEFGSGASTFCLVDYKCRDPNISVTSIDESQEWQNVVKNYLSEFQREINFIRIPREVQKNTVNYNSENLKTLVNSLAKTPDLIYVDGPSCIGNIKNSRYKKSPCTDVVSLLASGAEPSLIIFDGRFDSVEYFVNSGISKNYMRTGPYRLLESNISFEIRH